jgi:ABC-type bacteriocin/lantibiotic exporter with double-glycine peptidase domain
MADRIPQQGADGSGVTETVRTLASATGSPARFAASNPDPVLDALSMVGAALDEPALDPLRSTSQTLVEDTIAASGWMPWRVLLRGRWHHRLTVPLYVRTGGAPAAVIPEAGGATLIEGGTRTVTRLRSGSMTDITPRGVAFAPDLPEGARWWNLIWWSLRHQRHELWLLLVLAAVTGVGALLLPLTTGALFEVALPLGRLDLVLALLAAFALASVGLAILGLRRGHAVVRIRDRMDLILGAGVGARLLRLTPGFFRARTVGDVANRALALETARRTVDDAVVSLLLASVFGLVSIGYLFAAGAAIGLVALLTVALVLMVSTLVQVRARSFLPVLLERRSQTDALLLSILGTIVSWRASGAEDRALGRWARAQLASTRAMRVRLRAAVRTEPVDAAAPMTVLTAFIVAVILIPVPLLAPGNPSAPGLFLAMYAAVAQVTLAMLTLTANLLTLSEYGPQLARLEPILAAPTERSRAPQRRLAGAIGVHQVQFGYRTDRTPLFQDLSFTVEPGEFVAIVGPSGSGKSTLMRLLLGFEQPWSGMVAYDGSDLARLDVASVRRQIGTVLQTAHPLGATVRDCICGPRHLPDRVVADIVERSGLADDIAALPQGLATPVGEAGAALSGGQRQRIMIAAALAGDPAILFLDEATSALDNATQAVVMRTVLESTATRLVIAHRLSTVRRADRVLVVANGTIAESGPPDVLLQADGIFARLAARQEL